MAVPIPENEEERLAELERYDILDSAPEPIYDDLVHLATSICGTEIAAITLIDEDRQWIKAERGLDADQTPREEGFCAHAITDPGELLVVENALEDERFRDNPSVVSDPNIRFYAGAPLRTPGGQALGTICAIDPQPGSLTEGQRRGLEALSRMVMTQLELRRRSHELRELKEELETVNEELDRFASVLSHELQDPISQVVSNLDLLELEIRSELEGEPLELLGEATKGADRMTELIGGILRYARAGKSTPERQHVEMGRILEQVQVNLARRIEEGNADIQVGQLPDVRADASQVRQVVKNLIHNAIKYREGDEVSIRVEAEEAGGMVRFSVEDDGIGIPAGDQDRLFQVFERASNTGDRAGTGVGLALSARIVERHGGEIGVVSEEGEGSRFWFTLPGASESSEGDEPPDR